MTALNTQLAVQAAVREAVYRNLPEEKARIASTLWDKLYC